jgi:hypothetical protein
MVRHRITRRQYKICLLPKHSSNRIRQILLTSITVVSSLIFILICTKTITEVAAQETYFCQCEEEGQDVYFKVLENEQEKISNFINVIKGNRRRSRDRTLMSATMLKSLGIEAANLTRLKSIQNKVEKLQKMIDGNAKEDQYSNNFRNDKVTNRILYPKSLKELMKGVAREDPLGFQSQNRGAKRNDGSVAAATTERSKQLSINSLDLFKNDKQSKSKHVKKFNEMLIGNSRDSRFAGADKAKMKLHDLFRSPDLSPEHSVGIGNTNDRDKPPPTQNVGATTALSTSGVHVQVTIDITRNAAFDVEQYEIDDTGFVVYKNLVTILPLVNPACQKKRRSLIEINYESQSENEADKDIFE